MIIKLQGGPHDGIKIRLFRNDLPVEYTLTDLSSYKRTDKRNVYNEPIFKFDQRQTNRNIRIREKNIKEGKY